MDMTLADYLASNGISQAELARRSGVARPHINRVLRGHLARFSVPAATKIAAVTNGAVSAVDLLGLPSGTTRRSAGGPRQRRKTSASNASQ